MLDEWYELQKNLGRMPEVEGSPEWEQMIRDVALVYPASVIDEEVQDAKEQAAWRVGLRVLPSPAIMEANRLRRTRGKRRRGV